MRLTSGIHYGDAIDGLASTPQSVTVPVLDGALTEALERIVSGLTALVLDFDGPATAYIGTDPATSYVTLCSHGVKPQGQEAPFFDATDAIEKYEQQLRTMIADNAGKQLAWRMRPLLECRPTTIGDPSGNYRVRSRLAFI